MRHFPKHFIICLQFRTYLDTIKYSLNNKMIKKLYRFIGMGVGKIFSEGRGARGDFTKIFQGAKSGEICFFPLDTKKTTLFC